MKFTFLLKMSYDKKKKKVDKSCLAVACLLRFISYGCDAKRIQYSFIKNKNAYQCISLK